jgi:hypothetical protein
MTKVVVYHENYGCETGCCGHAIDVDGKRVGYDLANCPNPGSSEAELKAYAENLIREELGVEHVANLDWDNCIIVAD